MIDSSRERRRRWTRPPGVAAMSRLADRLRRSRRRWPRRISASPPLPAVFAGGDGGARPQRGDVGAPPNGARAARVRSSARVVDSFVAACSFIPYALVALALRLVMARVIFLDGQTRIDGPRVPFNVHGFDLSVVLPLHVKTETFTPPHPIYRRCRCRRRSPLIWSVMPNSSCRSCCCSASARACRARPADHDRADPDLHDAAGAVERAHLLGRDPAGAALARGGQISVDAIVRAVARRPRQSRGDAVKKTIDHRIWPAAAIAAALSLVVRRLDRP